MNNNVNDNSSMNVNDQPPQCANGCGFFGNPATQNLCSVCFRGLLKKTEIPMQTQMKPMSNNNDCVEKQSVGLFGLNDDDIIGRMSSLKVKTKRTINRCDVCNKRVGLTGFECRCDGLYCASHRYPEEHCCEFDHKGHKVKALSKELFSAASDLKAAKINHRA